MVTSAPLPASTLFPAVTVTGPPRLLDAAETAFEPVMLMAPPFPSTGTPPAIVTPPAAPLVLPPAPPVSDTVPATPV